VAKPWGHETIWARTERYVGKILHVRAGESLSLQYHERKDETIRVLSGVLRFEVGASVETLETVRLGPGEGWRIPAGTRHRMTALEDTDVLEVSTPELDDVVRLEDRYGRAR
jgi:mannose-6-phosphate isomerase-like protein (cupin superfamily)